MIDIKKPKRIRHRIVSPLTPEATLILAFSLGIVVGWGLYSMVISQYLK